MNFPAPRNPHRPIFASIEQNKKFEHGEWRHMTEHTITDGKITTSGTNPISKFAKDCIAAGYDEKRDLIVKRGKTVLFTPATLLHWSKKHDAKTEGKVAPESSGEVA